MSLKKSKLKVGFRDVVFLNPQTCGIYKSGGLRFKTDPATGKRTTQVDNELAEVVADYLSGKQSSAIARKPIQETFEKKVLVPRYFDPRWNTDFEKLLAKENTKAITLAELTAKKIISITGGHGSPSNDQRTGAIPYIKVSDIRSLKINVNPTNLVSRQIAESFWGGPHSGLQAWDLITPNRASSNIGEFAILLPGEEDIVLTKEVFIIRVMGGVELGIDHFYLFWALCLKAVRRQWQRITLMQTNREDCGNRFLEIQIPFPKSKKWAKAVSEPFRDYFATLAEAKTKFISSVSDSSFDYIASVKSTIPVTEQNEEEITPGKTDDVKQT